MARIHRDYWVRKMGQGRLDTTGIYRYIRHPQYMGFFMITLGVMTTWATIPLIVLSCLLLARNYRLAKREERDMEAEFGSEYQAYRERTKMFIPCIV